MALFGFKVRNPERDHDTDSARMQLLSDTLASLILEIEGERAGLNARREKAADNAAFSMEALENEGGTDMSRKVDGLTGSMARYAQRIVLLQGQIEFVSGLLETVDQFAQDNGVSITQRNSTRYEESVR